MKKITLFLLMLAFSLNSFSQISITSSQAVSTEGGINVNLSTYCLTVPVYLGYNYTIDGNQINISVCYHITPLLMETPSNHHLFIETTEVNDYEINLTIFSSESQDVCDYSSIINVSSIPLSKVNFDENLQRIRIFPNPSNGSLQIEALNQTIRSVKIYNATGQLVKNTPYVLKDISDLENGIYLLIVETENGKVSKKIILNK